MSGLFFFFFSFFQGPLTLSAYSTGLSQPTGCLPFSKGHQTFYQIVLVLSFVKAITVFWRNIFQRKIRMNQHQILFSRFLCNCMDLKIGNFENFTVYKFIKEYWKYQLKNKFLLACVLE